MATAVVAPQARRVVGGTAGVRVFRMDGALLFLMAVPCARDSEVIAEIARGALVVRVQPGGGICPGHPEGGPCFFRRLDLPFTPRSHDITAWICKGVLLVRIALPQPRNWEHHDSRPRWPVQRRGRMARTGVRPATP